MTHPFASQQRPTNRTRRGMALLICLFVVGVTSALLVGILNTCTIEYSAVRNTTDYEAALYLAGAAVHHALAELEQNPTWTTGISATEFPAGSGRTYSATIAAGLDNTIIVTGVGTAGATTRRLEVTVSTQG
jgi:type II secretory pathway component PulK